MSKPDKHEMILDFNSTTGSYIIRVPRKDGAVVQDLMRNHGLNFSLPASTAKEAVLFTTEPYAAATFWESATDAAKQQLGSIYNEIQASWQAESGQHITCPPE